MSFPEAKRRRIESSRRVYMVTGGTGMVGKAIEMFVEAEKREDEKWIFLSRKDGDLRCEVVEQMVVPRVIYLLCTILLFP